MKKLLLLLFLVACTFMVARAIAPAVDSDVGCNVTYVMPSDQVSQSFVMVTTPVMQILYLDVRATLLPLVPDTKQLVQCNRLVIPHYKGPNSSVCVNNPTTEVRANFT